MCNIPGIRYSQQADLNLKFLHRKRKKICRYREIEKNKQNEQKTKELWFIIVFSKIYSKICVITRK